jgi:histidine triad (HIT) family protein
MAYDSNNPFARILRGELPSIPVYENEHVLAIMDIMPQSPGHMLILPKVAGENLLDTPAESLAASILAAQRVARAIDKALNPAGIVITQFNRAPAGQTVFHLHIHVIPVYEDREWQRHARLKADPMVLEAQATAIRAALA